MSKVSVEIVETPNNYKDKVALIREILEETKKKKVRHYSIFSKCKIVNTIIKSCINTLNAVSVSSIILTYSKVSIDANYELISLVSTSSSSILSALMSSIDLEGKIHSHNTSYLQYTDIYRDVSARLLRNGFSSNDLDILLGEINNRIGLIEDTSLPV
tara:strand:+ start:1967 stop:2440 length:474 start_codon:yes stop_codon:yes gene_type:complete